MSETTTGMDAEAVKAALEFKANKTAKDVASWWKRWYKTAGHKRLAKILLGYAE